MKYDKKQMKEALIEKVYTELQRDGNFYYGGVFNGDVKMWRPKEETNYIDVIFYLIGKEDPDPRNVEGTVGIRLILFVHKNVGVNNEDIVCPANWSQPCPICKHVRKLKIKHPSLTREEWRKIIGPFSPSKRNFCYIVPRIDEEQCGNEVFIWETNGTEKARLGFNKIEFARDRYLARHGGGTLLWASHDEEGKTFVFERQGTKLEDTAYSGFRFVNRNYVIPQKLIDDLSPLDELVNVKKYDEIKSIFLGSEEENNFDKKSSQNVLEDTPFDGGTDVSTVNDERKEKISCPNGYKIGEEWDLMEECKDCPDEYYNSCQSIYQKKHKV